MLSHYLQFTDDGSGNTEIMIDLDGTGGDPAVKIASITGNLDLVGVDVDLIEGALKTIVTGYEI